MKKKITALMLLALLVVTATLTACATNKNDKIIVATLNGEKITRTEYLENWESKKASYGITQEILDNPNYVEDLEALRESVLQTIITQKVLKAEFKNLGFYDLTQAEHESVKTNITLFKQNILASYEAQMLAELGSDYTEKDYVKAINKYTQIALEEAGIDEELLEDTFTYEVAINRAEAELLNLSVADADVIALFDEKVEADKEFFSDLAAYEYYTTEGEYQPYYIPEGLRMIRHVLIIFDDETLGKINEQRTAGNDDEAVKLIEAAWKVIEDEAMEVLTQLNDGTINFDTAILNYNDDPGMQSFPDGYEVSDSSTRYVPEFTDGAMALTSVGDISDLVGTDYGYHILEYTSNVVSGAIDYELVKDTLMAEASETKRAEEWQALIDAWLAKHEVVYFYENIYEELVEEVVQEAIPQ